jgi:hypothetical protein
MLPKALSPEGNAPLLPAPQRDRDATPMRLTVPWARRARQRRSLAEAQRVQDAERRAAYARLSELARTWNGATERYPVARPLMTRGQAARTRKAGA